MVDFGGSTDNLDDTVLGLFTKQAFSKAVGEAGKAALNSNNNRKDVSLSQLNAGVQTRSIDSPGKAPGKSVAAAVEDPADVEARWMARLAKFAGIAQTTGTKINGI